MMNKQKGNMYSFCTHTWNAIKGKCSHDCSYCYMKRFLQNPIRLDEKELKTDLGEKNFIFVGSSTDMFAESVDADWIGKVLDVCKKFDNKYLFQSKNPSRFVNFEGEFPKDFIFGITLETNRGTNDVSLAPTPFERAKVFMDLNVNRMISIEPIMDFDLEVLVAWIRNCFPDFVSIGADSKGHSLPEPSWDKVQDLIKELKKFTEVKVKDNLNRLNKRRKD